MIDFAVEHLRLAGAAEAMSAGMWKIDAGAKTGVENGLPLRRPRSFRPEARWSGFVAHVSRRHSDQLAVPLQPARPGVQKRISDLWPMEFSAIDFDSPAGL